MMLATAVTWAAAKAIATKAIVKSSILLEIEFILFSLGC
jgi:hypothetical protein